MARPLLAPFVPRPRHLAALFLPALALALTAGCGHHKRASLRPVYTSPPASAPCATGDCGSSIAPSGSLT
ncbi:MAG: hypothetical protein LC745_08205, partial [Planctomycetia bacterium]|nr:hypothetical protein [Planctomycetia bacterium]